jgi:hypothetical protein
MIDLNGGDGWALNNTSFPPLVLSLFVMLCLIPGIALGQKTDVITFKNGDKITVDIKELERGILRATTVGMGTIHIEWDVIESIETHKLYDIELSSGRQYLGSISSADDGKQLSVSTVTGPRQFDLADVTTISRIKRNLPILKRIDGSVQFGLNFASGSQVGQVNFGLSAWFQETQYIVGTDFSATLTTGSSEQDTRRMNWGLGYYRQLEDRWFWVINSDLDRNDELGIDLRLLGGGGLGRFLIKNNHSRWSASAGLAASRELRNAASNETLLEGQLTTDYSYFFFSPTKTDLSLKLTLYPGITESDRLRGNFDTKLRWEIITDLFWDLTYYFTWDNQPPTGASSEDTGITTSIGYTF